MASFSYQHQPILVDSISIAKNNMSGILLSSSLDQYHQIHEGYNSYNSNSNICFPSQFYLPILDHFHGIPVNHHVSSGTIMNNNKSENNSDFDDQHKSNNNSLSSDENEPYSSIVTKKHSADVNSTELEKLDRESSEQVTQKIEKKRKITRNNSAQSKDAREKSRSSKKQKSEKVKVNSKKDEGKKGQEEPPIGYIHVRARRGQATDSHSLAERVRREKISERMKMLQKLVPGCEKVTGKALMLDEIINYVQSLQNQVEFLSMKLASLNPMLYDFGMDSDTFVIRPEIQSTAENNYQNLMDTSASHLLQHGQMPNVFSHDNVSLMFDMEEQRQSFHLNPSGFNNLCSFT